MSDSKTTRSRGVLYTFVPCCSSSHSFLFRVTHFFFAGPCANEWSLTFRICVHVATSTGHTARCLPPVLSLSDGRGWTPRARRLLFVITSTLVILLPMKSFIHASFSSVYLFPRSFTAHPIVATNCSTPNAPVTT